MRASHALHAQCARISIARTRVSMPHAVLRCVSSASSSSTKVSYHYRYLVPNGCTYTQTLERAVACVQTQTRAPRTRYVSAECDSCGFAKFAFAYVSRASPSASPRRTHTHSQHAYTVQLTLILDCVQRIHTNTTHPPTTHNLFETFQSNLRRRDDNDDDDGRISSSVSRAS